MTRTFLFFLSTLKWIKMNWKRTVHNPHGKTPLCFCSSFVLVISFSPFCIINLTALQLKLMALSICMYIYSIINLFIAPGSCLLPERMHQTIFTWQQLFCFSYWVLQSNLSSNWEEYYRKTKTSNVNSKERRNIVMQHLHVMVYMNKSHSFLVKVVAFDRYKETDSWWDYE